MSLDDEKYKSLREALKSSPRIRAQKDFDTRLLERIREAEQSGLQNDALKHHPQVVKLVKPKSRLAEMFSGLFKPSLAPALGLTVVLMVAVVVYFGYFNKMNDQSEQMPVVSTENRNGELIIYIRSGKDSLTNYPREYSAITETESERTGNNRTIMPEDVPSDYFVLPEIKSEREDPLGRDPMRLDKVSEEQKIEMQKEYKESKDGTERKSDDVIMKKEGKLEPKKSKTEGTIRDEKKNVIVNEEDNESVEPNKEVNQQTIDTGNMNEQKSRISRAIKDSTKTKIDSNDTEETIQQK